MSHTIRAHKTENNDPFPASPGCISEEPKQSITMTVSVHALSVALVCKHYLSIALIHLPRIMEDSATAH